MKVLIYIEPHPIRNSKTHFVDIARSFMPLLAASRSDLDVRIFTNAATCSALGDIANKHRSLFINSNKSEEDLFDSYMMPWDDKATSYWLDLMAGQGRVSDEYYEIIQRVWNIFPFDAIIHWGENGAITRFLEAYPVARIAMELGCTRPPFRNTLVLDPYGTNGSAVVPNLQMSEIQEIVGSKGLSSHESLSGYSNNLESLGYEQQFHPVPKHFMGQLAGERQIAFLPLQLYDDANLLRFSPYATIKDVVLDVVPKLAEHGYKIIIKPHPASKHRPGGNIANEIARNALQPWAGTIIWCDDSAPACDNARLISLSDLVVTVNSSVGFEALYFDKTVVVLGDAIYKPKNLFPTIDQVISGDFNKAEYSENIGYLRRFFLGGYLQPANIISDPSAMALRIGILTRLQGGGVGAPYKIARDYWRALAPAIQNFAETAMFAGLPSHKASAAPAKPVAPVKVAPASPLQGRDHMISTWSPSVQKLLAHSGCSSEEAFGKWLNAKILEGEGGISEIIVAGQIIDNNEYIHLNPDVSKAGFDPLTHYARHGFNEGRKPRVDLPPLRLSEASNILMSSVAGIIKDSKVNDTHQNSDASVFFERNRNKKNKKSSGLPNRIFDMKMISQFKDSFSKSESLVQVQIDTSSAPQALALARALPMVSTVQPKPEQSGQFITQWAWSVQKMIAHSKCESENEFSEWLDARISEGEEGVSKIVSAMDAVHPEQYLELNPDVSLSGMDPVNHFTKYGFHEGRQPQNRLPALRFEDAAAVFKSSASMIFNPASLPIYSLIESEFDFRIRSLKEIKKNINSSKNKILVVAHLYYTDLVSIIIDKMHNINEEFDLIITLPDWGTRIIREKVLAAYPDAQFYHAANRGRDIGPFIDLLPLILERDYDAVLKVQTKRGYYQGGQLIRELGELWREEMLQSLVGSRDRVSEILDAFRSRPGLKMVGPEPYYLSLAEYPYQDQGRLAHALLGDVEPSAFFAGTMFWVQPDCLRPLLTGESFSITSFAPESGANDGALAHLVERMFGHAAGASGHLVMGAPIDTQSPLTVDLTPNSQRIHDYMEGAMAKINERKREKIGALTW
ncbi:rhamnan synthesis F family protein [Castellaniella sp.]|uniref:rhamnan synthesis F family protein n=1 Tax=Castellaniella sp. TaxID=1955812 RepID=UPI002AFEC902|nr:rhamnan synthesis F family protein [Castellaniella sp.]